MFPTSRSIELLSGFTVAEFEELSFVALASERVLFQVLILNKGKAKQEEKKL